MIGLEYEMRAEKQNLIVKVKGELDHHYADMLRKKIDAELVSVRFKNVIFDFSGLTFMDSSGIGMLMGRYKTVRHLGGGIKIVCTRKNETDRYGRNVPDGIERILDMSGVFRFIGRYATVEEALAENGGFHG